MNKTGAATGAMPSDAVQPVADLGEDEALPFVIQDGEVLLQGSRSRTSGSMAFPQRHTCLETGARDMEPFLFGSEGVLYSFATIHVSSSREVPYTLGYVDFHNGVRVLAHVRQEQDGPPVACDQSVKLCAEGAHWYVTPIKRQTGE